MSSEEINEIIETALDILSELDDIATTDDARHLLRNLYDPLTNEVTA
jgi:hypothetical protein